MTRGLSHNNIWRSSGVLGTGGAGRRIEPWGAVAHRAMGLGSPGGGGGGGAAARAEPRGREAPPSRQVAVGSTGRGEELHSETEPRVFHLRNCHPLFDSYSMKSLCESEIPGTISPQMFPTVLGSREVAKRTKTKRDTRNLYERKVSFLFVKFGAI